MSIAATDFTPPPARRPLIRRRSAIPGFGLTLGVTLSILSLIVLIPLTAVVIKSAGQSPSDFFQAAFDERALRAYGLSFGAALSERGIANIPQKHVLIDLELYAHTLELHCQPFRYPAQAR